MDVAVRVWSGGTIPAYGLLDLRMVVAADKFLLATAQLHDRQRLLYGPVLWDEQGNAPLQIRSQEPGLHDLARLRLAPRCSVRKQTGCKRAQLGKNAGVAQGSQLVPKAGQVAKHLVIDQTGKAIQLQ